MQIVILLAIIATLSHATRLNTTVALYSATWANEPMVPPLFSPFKYCGSADTDDTLLHTFDTCSKMTNNTLIFSRDVMPRNIYASQYNSVYETNPTIASQYIYIANLTDIMAIFEPERFCYKCTRVVMDQCAEGIVRCLTHAQSLIAFRVAF